MPPATRQFTAANGNGLPQTAPSIDGVLRPAVRQKPAVPTIKRQANVPAYRRQVQSPPQARPSFLRRLWRRIRLPSLLIGSITAGLLLQQVWFGTVAIIVYGILSFVFRIPSRTTFALAAIALGAVCAILLIGSSTEVAHSFATYTFLLLVLGVIALSLEAKPQKRRKRRNGR